MVNITLLKQLREKFNLLICKLCNVNIIFTKISHAVESRNVYFYEKYLMLIFNVPQLIEQKDQQKEQQKEQQKDQLNLII